MKDLQIEKKERTILKNEKLKRYVHILDNEQKGAQRSSKEFKGAQQSPRKVNGAQGADQGSSFELIGLMVGQNKE